MNKIKIQKKIPQFRVLHNENKRWLDNSQITITADGRAVFFYREALPTQTYTNSQTSKITNCLIEDVTICRFTGIFDKYNIPIYEHDVLDAYSFELDRWYRNIVIFKDGLFCLKENEQCRITLFSKLKNLGNIIQNPELMEYQNNV